MARMTLRHISKVDEMTDDILLTTEPITPPAPLIM